ncbi:hypothetical protein AAG565_07210 [Fontimonas sp. SYSU GA230001]|uniref:hypothetical protein n=1 Tax=Fontimonas sp. SYSU GA230001 TaxID=3142450 RepID=UPI0032B517F2
MTNKPFVSVSALALAIVTQTAFAQAAGPAAEALAAAAWLPAASMDSAQPHDELQVEAPTARAPTPAERHAAQRKAREELRRRFGPSIHILN